MTLHAFTDGASRGNPGESGIGVIIKDEQNATLVTHRRYIGEATNNIAEYEALLACLNLAEKFSCERLIAHSDSELMVRQLQGKYRVKHPVLRKYFEQVKAIVKSAPYQFEIIHVTREENKEADELANVAINLKETASPTDVWRGVDA